MKTIDDIAAELAGYDPQALNVSTVNTFLSQLVDPVTDVEEVGIFEALGRVLAQDITSPISVPPHDNSAMDLSLIHTPSPRDKRQSRMPSSA